MGTGPATYDATVGTSFIEFLFIFGPLLVAYALCILVAGRLAAKRGRDRPRWTFYTVLFGPFALIALAVLPHYSFADQYDENGWPKRRRWGWGRRRRRSSSSSSSRR